MNAAALPPGPSVSPLRQTLNWIYRPLEWMDQCARQFGPVFTLRPLGYPPNVFLADPEAIREVFQGDAESLWAGGPNALLKPVVGAKSVLLLDEKPHHRERKLMMPPFHGERMQAYGGVMREAAERSIAEWPAGEPFALHDRMQGITLEVILRAVFGVREDGALAPLRERIRQWLEQTANPILLLLLRQDGEIRAPALHRLLGPLGPYGRFERRRKEVDEVLFEEIAQRRKAGGKGEDILSMLVAARDEAGAPMSDQELRDEMITLLVAGHETTATAMVWTMYRLLANPDQLARVRAELAKVTGGGPVGAEHVPQLEVLDAAIKEAMRLTPVLPIVVRSTRRPWRLGQWELPRGTTLAPCIYLTHRRPELWPEPERFDPDRFLSRKPTPYEFFPFGGGLRRCVGMAFAMYEMKVVLATVLQRVVLEIAPGYRAKMVRRGITFSLRKGLPVTARRVE